MSCVALSFQPEGLISVLHFDWVFVERHAFGIYATDATGLSGTADDAAF